MFRFLKKKSGEQPGPADPEAAPAEAASAVESPSPSIEPADDSHAAPASWRARLGGSALARGLGGLFSRAPEIDESLLEEIETTLLTSDVGVAATETVLADLRTGLERREFADAGQLLQRMRGVLVALLRPIEGPLHVNRARKPFVLLTVGVNGVGKTTTIGKLARRYADERYRVMLAAGDTFRAAAVQQLQTWGERNDVPVVAQGQGADSAAVIFGALQAAKARDVDLLIADTAGRLHTQAGLMDELAKVKRVLAKLDDSAPHEVLLVIDGTTGQNAVNQVRQFSRAVGVTGLVITKLDGTAKGGVVFALAREFQIPIRFVGLGEKVHDLRAFDADAFVDAMLPQQLNG
ncbi:MAG: signal recognition particle-docking protein FtsY [Xanthomonadales bacterium]|nr:signal recognition particle-docking protein FtsY [Xanthomonadales bacterium]